MNNGIQDDLAIKTIKLDRNSKQQNYRIRNRKQNNLMTSDRLVKDTRIQNNREMVNYDRMYEYL